MIAYGPEDEDAAPAPSVPVEVLVSNVFTSLPLEPGPMSSRRRCPLGGGCRKIIRTRSHLRSHIAHVHPWVRERMELKRALGERIPLTKEEIAARRAAAVRKNWQDPQFRQRNAAAVRRGVIKRVARSRIIRRSK